MRFDRTFASLSIFLLSFVVVSCGDSRSVEPVPGVHASLIEATLERFPSSPLTALLRFRTQTPSRVTVTIVGQDGEDLTKSFDGFRSEHEVPILGLYPDHPNTVVVRSESNGGKTTTDTLTIQTPQLPVRYRTLPLKAVRTGQGTIAPGFILLLLSKEYGGPREDGMFVVVDHAGQLRWVYTGDHWFLGKVAPNGNLVVQVSSDMKRLRASYNLIVESLLSVAGWGSVFRHLYWGVEDTHTPRIMERFRSAPPVNLPALVASWLPATMVNHNELREIDWFGREIASWRAEGYSIHHDFIFLPNGHVLALASTLSSDEDLIVEIGGDGRTIVREHDLKDVLDPRRPQMPRHVHEPDWLHANGLYYDGRDSTIVVSARNQSAIIRLSLNPLAVRSIVGDHEHWVPRLRSHLLEPRGVPFEWSWGQHAPVPNPEDPDHILVYDNGNQRGYADPAPPESSYSRAVEYEVDESARTVRQVWEFGREYGSAYYTPVVGNAEYLSNGNRLICFGAIARDLKGNPVEWIEPAGEPGRFRNRSVKSSAAIVETTNERPARVVFELTIEDPDPTTYLGYLVYRAHKISLY